MKIVITFLIVIFLVINTNAQTAIKPTGSGTQSDPYQIATLDNLSWLSQTDSVWSDYFMQTADINADSTKNWNGGAGFSPIGVNDTSYFSGTYNGGGYTIRGLYINRGTTNYIGIFGYTSGDTIKNTSLTNANINGMLYTGGIVGYNVDGTITNSYTTGNISGGLSVGGLIGYNGDGNITNSYAVGTVSGSGEIGGLVGYNGSNGNITNSYSVSSVSGNSGSSIQIGGLVGYNYKGNITNSYAAGTVSGNVEIGGLLGHNGSGTIINSFWNKDSIATGIGIGLNTGAIGEITDSMKTESTFTSRGWDFTNTWRMDTKNQIVNKGYPYLSWQDTITTPVEFTAFSAKVIENNIKLNWSTATEINNSGFKIERKMIKSNWRDISFIIGNGTSLSSKYYSYIDKNLIAGIYYYRIKQIDYNGSFKYSNTIMCKVNNTPEYQLNQNYPNPFNPSSTLSYSIPFKNHVILKVYNILGAKILTLVNKVQEAGKYEINFNLGGYPSGIYFYKITAGNFTATKKFILLK